MIERLSLPPRYRKMVEELLREHVPDAEVWAYGSRINGRSHEGSDLDLVLRGPGLERLGIEYVELTDAIRESNIPILVQVHDWAMLPETFHDEIEQDYIVVQAAATGADWQPTTLGECAVLVRDAVSPADVDGVPYLGLEHIGEGTLSLVGVGVASDVTSAKSRFASNDILFGKLRPYFRKVARPRFGGICSTDIWVVRPTEGVDAGYLFYVMASEAFVDAATRGSEGTKMPRAKWEFVSHFEFPLPPLEEQRVIARVLGALDDRIELNRRMSETLEEMARALFRSWFVDFEPVRAKAEGRPSGLPPDLDALFPASFEDSELGEIPAGWEVKSLGDVARERRKSVTPDLIAPDTPYIGLDHMPRRSIALSQWGTPEGLASNKSAFEQGDILFGKLRPYFRKVGVAPVAGICSTDIVVLEPTSSEWFGFVLGHASSDEFVDYTDAVSTGTKMPRTKWKDMARYTVALPDLAVAAAFDEQVLRWVTWMTSAIRQSGTLAAQRAALLPRLVSGELRTHAGYFEVGGGDEVRHGTTLGSRVEGSLASGLFAQRHGEPQ